MKDTIVVDYEPVPLQAQIMRYTRLIPKYLRSYITSTFPIFQWIHRYNLSWLVQDIIAGLTVGIVVVPQSMAYAKLANLDPQYGLYTSFVGVSIYCFFGTSKDISIGPISTVSLLVGQAVNIATNLDPSITGPEVGVTLALFAGIITATIGIIRLGILVDFIPGPAIAGYMTGSAITIALSQLPALAGTSTDVNTHDAPFRVLGEFLTSLPQTQLDIAFGLVSLLFLYGIKIACSYLAHRAPERYQKGVFLFNITRNGIIVIVGTVISYLVCRGQPTNPINVIQNVPAGFDAMGIPGLNFRVIQSVSSIMPSIVLIMILEHVSVAKSFGRVYNYTINPNQEILAIGISNVIGAFFGAYPATGAFSRTAIMARSGVKTPIAGVFSGAVVLLALYALTPAFYYIPEAVLAAVVIHAVSDLVSGPQYLKDLWRASPVDMLVWTSAVLVTFFVDVETGIYVAVGLSLAFLLLRVARPPVQTLGRVQRNHAFADEHDPNFATRFGPLPAGLIILRPTESILYPNAGYISEHVLATVQARTRCGETEKPGRDRPWNQTNRGDGQKVGHHSTQPRYMLPVLKAILLDMSSVRRMDATALHMLVNLRQTLNRYAGRTVEWHFAHLYPDVRRDLVAFGFGSLPLECLSTSSFYPEKTKAAVSLKHQASENIQIEIYERCEASCSSSSSYSSLSVSDIVEPESIDMNTPKDKYPCFHWDLESAVWAIVNRWNTPQSSA